jgi:2'-5' RNA ligase
MGLRCFVAIELPEKLKEEIAVRTEGLRKSGADAKWIKAENLHLTLKFLGDTPEDMLPAVKDSLEKALNGHEKFRLSLSGAGVFPDRKRPRVVWVGVEDSDRLVALQKDVEVAMAGLGFEAEKRPYSPHLTIGRLKSPRRRDLFLRELDAVSGEEFGKAEVAEISVMKSILKPSGAEHSRLFGTPFGS